MSQSRFFVCGTTATECDVSLHPIGHRCLHSIQQEQISVRGAASIVSSAPACVGHLGMNHAGSPKEDSPEHQPDLLDAVEAPEDQPIVQDAVGAPEAAQSSAQATQPTAQFVGATGQAP